MKNNCYAEVRISQAALFIGALVCLVFQSISSAESTAFPSVDDGVLKVAFFDASRHFDIKSIGCVSTDITLYDHTDDMSNQKLFKIILRGNDGKGQPVDPYSLSKDYNSPPTDALTIDSHSKCAGRTFSLDSTKDKKVLTLQWHDIDAGTESNGLDVIVKLIVTKGKPGIEWRININNHSKRYGVWLVDFPCLLLNPIAGKAENDYMVYPRGIGRIVKNPFETISRKQQGLLDTLSYPEMLNMQWLAVYDDQIGGLYFGAHDSTAHQKKINTKVVSSGLSLYLTHYPENMGQHGVGYQSPYPLIIQYCPANWYDVAQIYREWALQQIWASKGPLSARDDIPQWYKDVPFYFVTYSFDEPKGWASIDEAGITCMQFADRAIRYKEFFGYDGPIPMIWYQWAVFRPHETSMRHEGTPLDTGGTHSGHPFPAKQGFADAVAKLNANGIYTQGYINTRVYDIPSGFPPYVPVGLLPYTKKDINGDSRVWSGRCEGLVDLCRTTDFHQQLVTDNSTRLIREYNTKGSYLDQFATISNACFDPTHGHPLGGGDYQFHAIRNMADKIRNAGREIDPDAVFSGENGSDAFIDVLDGMLVHRDIYPGIIPVKEAVYGGYWSSYGRHMRRQNISNDIEFRMSVGNQFVYGIKIGRINVQSTKLIEQPQYQKNMQLLKKLVQYRFVAKDYLEYGRMLRPVRFQNAMPQITFKMPDEKLLALYNGAVSQPAIMSSVWQSPDGSMGIVLFNISGSEQNYRFTLPAVNYPLLGSNVKYYRLMFDGTRQLLGECSSDSLTLEGDLAVDEVFIVIVTEV